MSPVPSLLPSITVVDHLQVPLSFHPELQLVHTRISGYPSSSALRKALAAGVHLLQAENVSRWLFDERECLAIGDVDADWIETVWAPRARRCGLRSLAIVQRHHFARHFGLQRYKAEYALLAVRLVHFRELEPALTWVGSASSLPDG